MKLARRRFHALPAASLRRRRFRPACAGALILVVLATGAAWADTPGTTVTVTPSTGLNPAGQNVNVSGSGFVGNDLAIINQCAVDTAAQLERCKELGTITMSNGTFNNRTVTVTGTFTSDEGPVMNCQTNPTCTIWVVQNSATNNDHAPISFSGAGVPKKEGDFTGDMRADFAVYRPSNGGWFVQGGPIVSWGIGGDIPVPCDYTGDGKTDFAVYRPGNGGWFVNGGAIVSWGISGDIPVPGDYDGDGDCDMAVYRPSNGGWFVNGGTSVSWGLAGDIPVPCDYTGDGRTDFAVYRPGNGGWFVNGGTSASWGLANDVPQPADYTGDGRCDFAVYRPSNGGWFVNGGTSASWGLAGDVPLQLPDAIRRSFFTPL